MRGAWVFCIAGACLWLFIYTALKLISLIFL
jgi:hypothetical protein